MTPIVDPFVTLRLAGPADASVISQMVHELAVYERLEEHNHCTPEALALELERPGGLEAVVAEIDGAAVDGHLLQTYSTFAAARGVYLEDLYVRESTLPARHWHADLSVDRAVGGGAKLRTG